MARALILAAMYGIGFTRDQVKQKCRDIMKAKGCEVIVENRWLKGFLKRNSEVTFRKPSHIDHKRAKRQTEKFSPVFLLYSKLFASVKTVVKYLAPPAYITAMKWGLILMERDYNGLVRVK